jgi:hypothetical protein
MAGEPDDQKYKVPKADEMDYMQALVEGGLSCYTSSWRTGRKAFFYARALASSPAKQMDDRCCAGAESFGR